MAKRPEVEFPLNKSVVKPGTTLATAERALLVRVAAEPWTGGVMRESAADTSDTIMARWRVGNLVRRGLLQFDGGDWHTQKFSITPAGRAAIAVAGPVNKAKRKIDNKDYEGAAGRR